MQDLVLAEARRRLLRLLVGLDLGCAALHLATLALAGAEGGGPVGSADAGLLGLVGPLQIGLLAAALFRTAVRDRCGTLAWAGLAAGLLSAGDLSALPARLGAVLASLPGLPLLAGLSAPATGKLLAGAVLAAVLALLLWRAGSGVDPHARRVAAVLGRTVLALVLIALGLDLPAALGDGWAAPLWDLIEEGLEALAASWALADCTALLLGRAEMSQSRTNGVDRGWPAAVES